MLDHLERLVPLLTSVAVIVSTVLAGVHAALNKRDTRSAAGWIALIVVLPIVGAILYVLLGINRLSRRATRLRAEMPRYHHLPAVRPVVPADMAGEGSAGVSGNLDELVMVVDKTTTRPLLPGNLVTPLRAGDEAYPAMLAAIGDARASIALSTYIFDNDASGRRFAQALGQARARGVEVRVLIDDAGARYSVPPIDRTLSRQGVRTARFMPMMLPWMLPYANLRNHRKLLVCDGTVAFTGGMNIRHGCMLSEDPPHPTDDLHARVEGPVVAQLMEVFAEDWAFVTRERLDGPVWFPDLVPRGDTMARAVIDGPDENLDILRWTLLAAITSAHRSLRIITPYFLPDDALVTALNLAALRGVEVDILLPERLNLRVVQWAMWGELWKVLGRGCRVWLSPAPFDHSKLVVVDDHWTLLGSANWDPRSLRLNFELQLECHDPDLAHRMVALFEEKRQRARLLEPRALVGLSLPVRLRNGLARLLTPYL
jgi:cardiolipin synthase A/B